MTMMDSEGRVAPVEMVPLALAVMNAFPELGRGRTLPEVAIVLREAAAEIYTATGPLCVRCGSSDRMADLGSITTDFGGAVEVRVCRGCGVAAFMVQGERP